jgi:hypothetical protein
MKCKYNDCGWCYAPDDVKPSTSATPHKQCLNPDCCLNLKSQMTEKQSKENTTYITTGSGHPIDDDVVIINGVEYRKTVKPDIKPKVRTLYDICVEWNDDDYDPPVSALIFKIEKEWTPLNLNQKEKRGYTDGYSMGFDDALDLVRKTLK